MAVDNADDGVNVTEGYVYINSDEYKPKSRTLQQDIAQLAERLIYDSVAALQIDDFKQLLLLAMDNIKLRVKMDDVSQSFPFRAIDIEEALDEAGAYIIDSFVDVKMRRTSDAGQFREAVDEAINHVLDRVDVTESQAEGWRTVIDDVVHDWL